MRDVIIVGGGPAGLSAAVVLGRCRRSVLLIDSGQQRNHASKAMHNFLTRDGVSPAKFRQKATAEAVSYGVAMASGQVASAKALNPGFEIQLKGGRRYRSRKLLLATGVVDRLPSIPGFASFYGASIHHCPFCDAYEWRGRRLAAYGDGTHGAGLALSLRTWSKDVVVLSDGPSGLDSAARHKLAEYGIEVFEERLSGLKGSNGRLQRILFAGGRSIERDALFFNTGQALRSHLPRMLGCEIRKDGGIKVDRRDRTCVPGLFVAGDALRDIQFVVNAAAQGAVAAVTIHAELREEEGSVLQPASTSGRTRRRPT